MIKIKKLENKVRHSDLLAYDVGEIVKIVANPTMDSGNMQYYDSKGLKFVSSAKIGRSRDSGFCTIYALADRKNDFPAKYREEIFADDDGVGESVPCNDPRVIWVDIVSYWAYENGKCKTDEELSFFLTEFLPSYEEAANWLKKNRFPVFATHNYRDELIDPYYQDYGALVVPPDVDWSKRPDRE